MFNNNRNSKININIMATVKIHRKTIRVTETRTTSTRMSNCVITISVGKTIHYSCEK